ncbi:hypothetical protein TNCV_3135341 [Trichonephila clavipes]|nr:hypothetical protein TNCV_3135341 [Trichonephila clavipes]
MFFDSWVKDKPSPREEKDEDSDARDPEVIIIDQNETIDDIEEPNQMVIHSDTEEKRRLVRDREQRMRDSSYDESSSL